MKKLLIISFILFCFGCSKKSTPDPSPTIVGKWYVKQTIETNSFPGPQPTVDTAKYSRNNVYLFNSDLSGSQTIDGEVMPFTYTLSGATLIIKYAGSDGTPPTNSVKYLTVDTFDFVDTESLNGSVNDVFETQLIR